LLKKGIFFKLRFTAESWIVFEGRFEVSYGKKGNFLSDLKNSGNFHCFLAQSTFLPPSGFKSR
jgi:hypothetical protein